MPQGSCAGPVIFLGYLSSLYDVINKHLPNIRVGGYADDHQLYLAYEAGDKDLELKMIKQLENCISDVREWMIKHHLKINDSKTEVMVLGTQAQIAKIYFNTVKVGQSNVKLVTTVRNLGVLFDQQLTMSDHVNNVCRKGYAQLRKIRQIRKYLDNQAAEQIVHAFITSNIDYCNTLFYGAPKSVIQKLQRLQNASAIVISGLRKYESCQGVLKSLHWLPVAYRIEYNCSINF